MNNAAASAPPVEMLEVNWSAPPPKIAPGTSPGRGRGLFATAPIAAGDVIDRVCTIPLTSAQCDALEGILPLGDYYFRHPMNAEEGLLLLGLVSLANHSDDPNASVRFAQSENVGWIAELVALRPITPHAEITHRYRCAPWFQLA
ncbi:MAG TPA: SET domain-containing protein-lysine N-methyltransferase [Thermohalobaculum sp.]|nr:SET domain-containing protein-lysine N-methyltransferase [Thermohalobaculum sp.]